MTALTPRRGRGRPPTGCPKWNARKGVWEVRPRKPDGTRWPAVPLVGLAEHETERARRIGALIAQKYQRGEVITDEPLPLVVETPSEDSVSAWFAKYYAAAKLGQVGRKNRGKPHATADTRQSRFATWIEPAIGAKKMVEVSPADLRVIVRKLDDAVRERIAFYELGRAADGHKPGISPKTAQNIWSEVTSAFREARSSKVEQLRVRDDDPSQNVQGPITGADREQAALFPEEVVTLLSCTEVPLWRRQVYAVAIYTGCRRSELARLTAADVDHAHAIIRIRGTKTDAAKRTVAIEPALRPLLQALCDERPKGPLLTVPRADGKGGSSDLVKRDLQTAGLTRTELTRDDGEHMPFTFHGLRHTAITHWAVSGMSEMQLLATAGHTDFGMTRRYLAAASALSAKFGEPHPPLPTAVFPSGFKHSGDSANSGNSGNFGTPSDARNGAISRTYGRPQRELNFQESRNSGSKKLAGAEVIEADSRAAHGGRARGLGSNEKPVRASSRRDPSRAGVTLELEDDLEALDAVIGVATKHRARALVRAANDLAAELEARALRASGKIVELKTRKPPG